MITRNEADQILSLSVIDRTDEFMAKNIQSSFLKMLNDEHCEGFSDYLYKDLQFVAEEYNNFSVFLSLPARQ